MFETVKVVKGHEIKRQSGKRGAYFVSIREDNGIGYKEFHTFKTIKAAEEFIENL